MDPHVLFSYAVGALNAMKFSKRAGLFSFKHSAERHYPSIVACTTVLSLFVLSAAVIPMPSLAQNAKKLIYLSETSSIDVNDIAGPLKKDCPDISLTTDKTSNDYVLEASTRVSAPQDDPNASESGPVTTNELVLFDRDHILIRASSSSNLGNSLKDICHAIKNAILIQIVDSQTLTESLDVRGVSGGSGLAGAVGTIVNDTTGRRTHTDNSLLYVIANGEHAILNCYERRTGCVPVGDGKYYAEFDGESLWVDFRMPLIHTYVRNHYVVAGGW
jgi:hypothetical protein